MVKYGFVYIWYDRKNKRYYIGAHWGTEDDGYICSSRWMRNSYNRRPHDFKRRILRRIYIREGLFELEDYYLNMIKDDEFGKRYYNLQKYWRHWSAKEQTRLTTRQKMSASGGHRKGKTHTADAKEKNRLAHLGKSTKHTSVSKEKLRQANIGKRLSSETRQKISILKKGIKLSEEHKAKMRITHKSIANSGRFKKGYKRSLESIQKQKETMRINTNFQTRNTKIKQKEKKATGTEH